MTGLEWLTAHRNYDGDGCLTWPLGCDPGGYGQVGVGNRIIRKAHRVMCELVHGAPPSPDHEASHECGNGHLGCVHPKHVFWKTRSQNQQDRVRHGRIWNGPAGTGKITEEVAAQIRALKGKKTQRELAAMFGCSRSNISLIQLGIAHPPVRTRRVAVIRNPLLSTR